MNQNNLQATSQAIGDHAFHRNLHQAQIRSGFAAFLLWFFLGGFGAHLMYLRRWTMLIFYYLMAILTMVGVALVFRNNDIHSLGVGLAALWMAFVPLGIYNFGSLCILFAQVNYCNEDSALSLAGQKTARARMPEKLLILVSGGALAIFIGAMATMPSQRAAASATSPNATEPASAVQQANPASASSAPAANVEQDATQAQVNAAEPVSQVVSEADTAQAQQQQPTAQAQPTQDSAIQQPDTSADLNTTPNQVYGTSFDCGQSHSQNEYLICHTPALASADVKLANAVTTAKSALDPIDLAALKDRMRGQWNFREKHCNDVTCLNSWYTYQINTMELITQTRNVSARLDTTQN